MFADYRGVSGALKQSGRTKVFAPLSAGAGSSSLPGGSALAYWKPTTKVRRGPSKPCGASKTNRATEMERPHADESEYLDRQGVALLLNVKENWVKEKTRRKEIPFYEFGKFRRYSRTEIIEWAKTFRKGPQT